MTNDVALPSAESSVGFSPRPRLVAYQVEANACPLVPGVQDRDWMDASSNRFAYRCLPLTIANTSGWQLLCPFSFTAYWNGGNLVQDMRFEVHEPVERPDALMCSHFGHGILTFHPGYLFRTDPGWAVWARGAPNHVKDGIQPLDGLVETDWLPFTFTMNWLFTRPGFVHFEKGEPFCFITPMPHLMLDAIEPVIVPMASDPELQARYREWSVSRNDFNKKLHENDPQAVKQGWQKYYIHGKDAAGEKVTSQNVSKRKLAVPKRLPSLPQE